VGLLDTTEGRTFISLLGNLPDHRLIAFHKATIGRDHVFKQLLTGFNFANITNTQGSRKKGHDDSTVELVATDKQFFNGLTHETYTRAGQSQSAASNTAPQQITPGIQEKTVADLATEINQEKETKKPIEDKVKLTQNPAGNNDKGGNIGQTPATPQGSGNYTPTPQGTGNYPPDTFIVYVSMVDNSHEIQFKVKRTTKIAQILKSYSDAIKQYESLRCYFNGKRLSQNSTMEECGLRNGDRLHIFIETLELVD